MYFRHRSHMDRFYVVNGASVRYVCKLRNGQLERVDSPAYVLLVEEVVVVEDDYRQRHPL